MLHKYFGTLAALGLILAPSAALAHHTVAMYNLAQPINLAGTVKSFELAQPHSWLTLTTTATDGSTTDWLVECNSVALLQRSGWSPTSLKVGDQIKVTIAPHYDGIRRGEAIRVVTANGATLNNVMDEP